MTQETNNPAVKKTPILDAFGIDLTKRAREGKIDPVIGREKEIKRLNQILSRRTKKNGIIIGQPGVGKCICSDTLVTIRNDETGEVRTITVKEFTNTLP